MSTFIPNYSFIHEMDPFFKFCCISVKINSILIPFSVLNLCKFDQSMDFNSSSLNICKKNPKQWISAVLKLNQIQLKIPAESVNNNQNSAGL